MFRKTTSIDCRYSFPTCISTMFFFLGTPAARMKKVPSNEVKKRSRELTSVFESFSPYQGMEGKVERIWITEIATDGVHLVSAYQFLSLIADYMFMPRVKLTLK